MVTSARFLALSLLVCAAPGGSQTAPVKPVVASDAPVPVEVFAKLPALDNPQLSPDGMRIAAKIAINGAQHLVVLPLADHSKAAVIKSDPNQDINWWRWVGDDHLAVGLGQQQTLLGEDVYVTRILGVSADLKQMRQLDWTHAGLRADDLLWIAHDGSPRIIYARQTGIETMDDVYPSVWESDLSTGKTRRITPGRPDVWDWFVDGAGVVRMGKRTADASGKTALLYRTRNEDAFQTIARHDRKDMTSFVVPLTFRADGTALATDDASGRDELYEVSLPDLKLGKKVFGLDRYDIDGVIENRAGDDVIGVAVTDTRRHIVWLDPAMKETQALADKAVGNRTARIVSRSADDSRMLVEVGSASQAGTLYIWDVADGAMRRYAYLNADLGSRSLSPVKTVQYTARDGTPIEAVLTLPRRRAAKDLPLIVLPHGGPIARDREEWDWWTQYLAELGYAVIQPNYRGSSGYGTAFVKLGEGEWGLKMQDDLLDAIGYLAKAGIADPKRVCIAGASYGGYAALRAAQRDGASYRCAISYAGVSDLAGIKRYDAHFLNGETLGRYWSTRTPDLRGVSPRFGAEQVSIPILLMHGKADRRVPVRQSRDMAAALRAANKPFDYIEQPLGDHHFTRSEDRLQFLTAMAAFLAKYNPA